MNQYLLRLQYTCSGSYESLPWSLCCRSRLRERCNVDTTQLTRRRQNTTESNYTVVSEEFRPIEAKVAEDTSTDVSLHIRRILAENAVRASSVVALDESKEWADKSAPTQGESSRRWRRLILVFLCLILLAVVATVAAVVVMLTKDPHQN